MKWSETPQADQWDPTDRPMRPHRLTNENPQADEALALPLAVIHLVTVSTLGQVPQGAGPREAAEPLAVNTAVLRFSLTGIIPRHLQWHCYKTMNENIFFKLDYRYTSMLVQFLTVANYLFLLRFSNPQPQSIFSIIKMLFFLQII